MKYKVTQGFIIQKLGENIAIFDGEKSVLYTFNTTSYFIFKKIKSGMGETEIINLLVSRFDVSPPQARTDVNSFVKTLLKNGIISPIRSKKRPK